MPSSFLFSLKPFNASEISPLVVWYFFGTEMPYPSSHTLKAKGIFITHAAFTDSQNKPSEVEASPIVAKHTSLPLSENLSAPGMSLLARYNFEANAKPTARNICEAVGEASAEEFFICAIFFQLPFSSKLRVAK